LAFFGELYLRSTLPFLGAEVTHREVEYLAAALGGVQGRGAVIDLGCGHGRHAAALRQRGVPVVGLERDPLSLAERLPGFPAVRADLRALPFATARLAGAYAWYSTLFIFGDDEHPALLRELCRALVPGGRLIFHSVPHERLAASPSARFSTRLPDGSLLSEESRFDSKTGRDRGQRTLALPDGRVLSGSYVIRYYPVGELRQLFESAGLAVKWVHGDLTGAPPSAGSTDLIIGAERRDG
jgi:SAM-dependent methyltransferase